MNDDTELSPGEAKTRQRRRRTIFYMAFSLILGMAIGLLLALTEEGEGSFFSSDFADLSLEPWIALAFAATFFLTFIVMPLWAFTQIDELLREQNLIGMAGGFIAVMSGYPIWVMLYAGGFAPYPHALGVFLMAYGGVVVSFLYVKLRDQLPF